jgi:RNA polymerase sigma-70 factor (ECF subfamily)
MIGHRSISSDNNQDLRVFEKIRSGDYKAFKLLFESYYDILCNFSLKFVDESYVADDVVQEVFINIWEKRKTLEISGSVKSYLYTAVKNRCLNRLKADKSRKLNTDYFFAQGDKVVDHSEIEQEEFRDHLFSCIEKLPPRCKEVFIRSRFDDLKQEKIAELLDITLKTVKAQIGKALKLLKTCLQPSYPEYF